MQGRQHQESQELTEEFNRAIQRVETQWLRGRMRFADSQLYGREGKRCIHVVSEFVTMSKAFLKERNKFFVRMFVTLLNRGEPRVISVGCAKLCVMLTDVCYETKI